MPILSKQRPAENFAACKTPTSHLLSNNSSRIYLKMHKSHYWHFSKLWETGVRYLCKQIVQIVGLKTACATCTLSVVLQKYRFQCKFFVFSNKKSGIWWNQFTREKNTFLKFFFHIYSFLNTLRKLLHFVLLGMQNSRLSGVRFFLVTTALTLRLFNFDANLCIDDAKSELTHDAFAVLRLLWVRENKSGILIQWNRTIKLLVAIVIDCYIVTWYK